MIELHQRRRRGRVETILSLRRVRGRVAPSEQIWNWPACYLESEVRALWERDPQLQRMHRDVDDFVALVKARVENMKPRRRER